MGRAERRPGLGVVAAAPGHLDSYVYRLVAALWKVCKS